MARVRTTVGDLHCRELWNLARCKGSTRVGFNDFDEAGPFPTTLDLRASPPVGKPFILNDKNEWLRKAYVQGEKSEDEYWRN